MKILNQSQIKQKIQRLAIEILEQNYNEKQIILAGINNNGAFFASLLHKALRKISEIPIVLTHIRLSPAKPLERDIELGLPLKKVKNQVVIVIDDVANTGRTIFYALRPLMEVLPKKVEVAVLVDRKHKSFPIQVDYVGLSLATTLKEEIDVQIRNTKQMAVYLR